jgi:hypothetical protein
MVVINKFGGGGGTPGGSDGQLQWNDDGEFAGVADSSVSAGGQITLGEKLILNGGSDLNSGGHNIFGFLQWNGASTWRTYASGTTQVNVDSAGTRNWSWFSGGAAAGDRVFRIDANGVQVNPAQGADFDFVVDGNTIAGLFTVDVGAERVGVKGTAAFVGASFGLQHTGDISTPGTAVGTYSFIGDNTDGDETLFGFIAGASSSNTAGSENGVMAFGVIDGGIPTTKMVVNNSGIQIWDNVPTQTPGYTFNINTSASGYSLAVGTTNLSRAISANFANDIVTLGDADGDQNSTYIQVDDGASYIKRTNALIEDIKETNSANYTVINSDYYISYQRTATGAGAIDLPALSADNHGRVLIIKDADYNAGTNNITISADGSDTVEDNATFVMDTDGQAITLRANNTTKNWELY